MGKCTVELYFYLIIPLFFSMSAVRADHGPDHDKQHDLHYLESDASCTNDKRYRWYTCPRKSKIRMGRGMPV